jgi:hypothetical protein
MPTRRSPANSERESGAGGPNAAGSQEDDAAKAAFWTEDDEDGFVAFLGDEKIQGKRGDGGSFKPAVWTAAAEHMKQFTTKGGVKTADACKSKWTRVRRSYSLLFNKLSNRFFKLRTAYKVVEALKATTGLPWSDQKGLNIQHDTEDTFNKLVKVS